METKCKESSESHLLLCQHQNNLCPHTAVCCFNKLKETEKFEWCKNFKNTGFYSSEDFSKDTIHFENPCGHIF